MPENISQKQKDIVRSIIRTVHKQSTKENRDFINGGMSSREYRYKLTSRRARVSKLIEESYVMPTQFLSTLSLFILPEYMNKYTRYHDTVIYIATSLRIDYGLSILDWLHKALEQTDPNI